MSLRFHWFLPTNGDGRDIADGGHGVATGTAGAIRPASLAYLGQIARSAEQLGFEAALTPTGAWCEDAWLTTAMLTEVTERLKFLVAFRPGLISPTLSAQMAATFQRHSKGLAREAGRTPRYGIRLHVITRDTSHEAWLQAGLGLSEFILSGYPHLEEAYWFGEGVLPILRQRGLWQHPDADTLDNTLNVTPFAPTSGPLAPPADRPRAERAELTPTIRL